jgi:hypothetical protein
LQHQPLARIAHSPGTELAQAFWFRKIIMHQCITSLFLLLARIGS